MAMYDLSIDERRAFVDNKFAYVIQQIDTLFDTNEGDVLGAYTFGTNYERFIWDLNISCNAISHTITNDILTFVDLQDCEFNVDTKIVHGTNNDIIMVEINIFFDNYYKTENYTIG